MTAHVPHVRLLPCERPCCTAVPTGPHKARRLPAAPFKPQACARQHSLTPAPAATGRLLVVPGDVDAPGLVCSIASANASYSSASSQCHATGLDLGTVSGAGSNVALRALAPADHRLWLGARRSPHDGTWRWPNGAELEYLNWAQGRPSGEGDCVEMTENGTWSDVACFAAAYTIPFACCGGCRG
jgi:hypothetical protein